MFVPSMHHPLPQADLRTSASSVSVVGKWDSDERRGIDGTPFVEKHVVRGRTTPQKA